MTRNYDAFTLAEVLVTLVIIGVIAAMTIPTLINKTNKQEYASRLKKAYSTMAQATNRIIAEEGNPKASVGGWATSAETVYNMYKKYLSTAKDCGRGNECVGGTYKTVNNIYHRYNNTDMHSLILADGTIVAFYEQEFSPDCSIISDGTNDTCLSIVIDLDGSKKLNVVSIDTFAFILKENGLFPAGCDYDESLTTNHGWGRTCKVLREGAINY